MINQPHIDVNPAVLIQQKFGSKAQLHNYLTQRLQIFLPPKQYCRTKFLLDIFQEKKSVVFNQQVVQYQVPSEPEVSVKLIFPELMHDEELMSYFDTERFTESNKLPPKSFFWGVLFTVRKDFAQALLNEVMHKRLQQTEERAKVMADVQLSSAWVGKLMEYPVFEKNGGRQCNIFSQLNRARNPKPRKTVQVPVTIREYQTMCKPIDDRHVTIRKVPNVIGNAQQEEDLS